MQRHRQVAATPLRQASETWDAISQLIVDTLDRSPQIERDDVKAAVDAAATVGRALIAAGHLDKHALVLVAEPVYLNITTVSGTAALALDENLGPVPGGATASDWMIHLPTPDPVADVVTQAAIGNPHLSADKPPSGSAAGSAKAASDGALNLEALAQRARENR